MLRTMLKSKIHRATVTQADLHYVGSVTVDADLMDAADLREFEKVQVVNVNNGARLETWMGHRPCFPDTLPRVGPAEGRPGLWLAFGHGHLGLTDSANTARLLAETMPRPA